MIQWFPGHMAKARKEIEEKLRLVDIVYELIDARIPLSSRNPMIADIVKNKPRLILMTKSNMADPVETKKWENYFSKQGALVLPIDSTDGFKRGEILCAVAATKERAAIHDTKIRFFFIKEQYCVIGYCFRDILTDSHQSKS